MSRRVRTKDPGELRHVELADVVRRIQCALWFNAQEERWEPDREWSSDELAEVAAALEDYGLTPGRG